MHRAGVLDAGCGHRGHGGLEGHPTFRARAGGGLADVGVHGAGVDDGGRGGFRRRGWSGCERDQRSVRGVMRRGLRVGVEIFIGRGAEAFGATGTAEVVGFASVVDGGFGTLRVNGHAADGVAGEGLSSGHLKFTF